MPTETNLPFEPNLDAFSGWLAGLPLKDRERYASLFSGLQALNEANPDPEFYFKALEQIHRPVFQAVDSLSAAFLGKPLPLEPGIRKLAKLSAQFQGELAHGYYTLTQARRFSRIFSVEDQGKILHRALLSYGQMLLRLALMYETYSRSTWLRMNELYRLAERENLSGRSEPCPELAHAAACSVEELYLRAVAFRLAAPYRLRQGDIQRVFDTVQRHGHLLAFGREPLEEGKKADFVVDLDSGEMPASLSRGTAVGKGDLRYVFVEPLRRILATQSWSPLNKEEGFSADLSNHLQVRLGASPEFLPDKKSLASILFAGYKHLVGAVARRGARPAFNLQPLDEHVLPISGGGSSKTTGAFGFLSETARPALNMPEVQADTANGLPCSVYPARIPGFYLVQAPGLELRSGQLLGLFTDGKLIQFGQICPGRVEAASNAYGFELLTSQVSLVRVNFDSAPKRHYKCFFSPAGEGRFSLITEPLRLRGGDGMGIDEEGYGVMVRYRVAKMLEKSAEFCQFEIIPETPGQ